MSTDPKHRYSLDEYLEKDFNSEARLEYWNGEIYDISGVSAPHARIEINLARFLGAIAVERGCLIFPANMRIRTPGAPPYRYADLSAVCGRAQYEQIDGIDVLANPLLLIEVLSDSTEAYDRGDKFSRYKSIPTFREYLLIAQHRPHVTQFLKEADGVWKNLEYNDVQDVVNVSCLDYELPLAQIYDGVTFDKAARNPHLRPVDPRLIDRN